MTRRPKTTDLTGRVLGVLFALFAIELAAQTGRWRWSAPAPHGADIYDMAMVSGIAVQAAEGGQLFTSDDLVNWYPRTTGITNSLRGLARLGGRLLVSAAAGKILWADSFSDIQSVDLGTDDWLEAVAADLDLAVAVGDNGAVYRSADGISWTKESTPFTTWLRGVAAGGGTFVAVGENGLIASRNNNGTWSVQSSDVASHLNRVAFIGQQFWIVGNDGVVLTANSSARSWTRDTGLAITNHLYTVTGSSDTVLVAGRDALWLQQNDAWSDQTDALKPAPAPRWTYNAAIWDDPLFLVAGRSGFTLEGFSTNAADRIWVDRSDAIRIWNWDLRRLPDFYICVGDHGLIQTSEDGVTWNLELTPPGATNSVLLGVGGSTNGLVIGGNGGTLLHSPAVLTNLVFTNVINGVTQVSTNVSSLLGIQWQSRTTPTTNDLMAVITDGNRWVTAGGDGTILGSDDGTNWSAQASPTTAFLSGGTTWSNGFVLTGDSGTILTSPDGRLWTSRQSGVTEWVFRVTFGDGKLVAAGENGLVLTSVDGITWTRQNTPTDAWLYAVGTIGESIYAAGADGSVIRTGYGQDQWERVTLPTRKALYGIAGTTDQLIAAGVEGTILRGILRESTEPIRFLDFSRVDQRDLISIAGRTDQRFAIDNSMTLTNWTETGRYEITDASGTILILKAAGTNDSSAEFLRGRLLP